MSNYFSDNEDLRFYFERGIAWEPLIELTEHGFRAQDGFDNADEAVAFYREIAVLVGGFVANEMAPHAAAIDRAGARLERGEVVVPARMEAIFEQLKELDVHGMCLPRELGGLNCPLMLYFVNGELFARADVGMTAHYGFHGGMATAMLLFSIMEGTTEFEADGRVRKTRFRKEMDEIVRGEAWGCMDITEPDAGSDMAQLESVATQDEHGNWRLSGHKIFITSGHGKYHFVIARTERVQDSTDPLSGLKGLSMFLVPAYEQGADGSRRRIVRLERVEHKLGHHASVTASLNFEDAPARLIGKRGEGFELMLLLMNGARIGVGFEAIGVCEAAYRRARDYAAERSSMGKSSDRHEMIADYLDEMRTDIQGLRAMAMKGAWFEEMSRKLRAARAATQDEAQQRRLGQQEEGYTHRARRITPLLKYLAAEKAVEMARRCLQIHGGNGYMTEYGAEKLLRDAMAMPIYEGTSQIQALMAMKDTLGGIVKNPQQFVRRMAQARFRSLSASDALERRVARIQLLSMGAQNHLITRTAKGKLQSLAGRPLSEWPSAFFKNWDPKRDFPHAMLHAERLTRLLADEAISEVLLEQARQHSDRRELLARYLERAEPRCRFLRDEITTTGSPLLARLEREQSPGQAAGELGPATK